MQFVGGERPVLDWATRLKVALGAARGIAYLHEDCNFLLFVFCLPLKHLFFFTYSTLVLTFVIVGLLLLSGHPRIIHRDIKSSNILLDNNYEAQVH